MTKTLQYALHDFHVLLCPHSKTNDKQFHKRLQMCMSKKENQNHVKCEICKDTHRGKMLTTLCNFLYHPALKKLELELCKAGKRKL